MATPETRVPLTEEERGLKTINSDYKERFGFHDAENYLFKAPKGLNREIVEKISEFKTEPQWMRDFRLKALDHFLARPQPTWGSALLGRRPRGRQAHLRPARYPRGRAQVPLRRRRAVRVRGGLPPGPRRSREA